MEIMSTDVQATICIPGPPNRKVIYMDRNPLKATAPVKFDIKMIVVDGQAVQLCSELRQARSRLLDVMSDANQTISTLESSFNCYLSLLYGFLEAVDARGESKLRHSVRFRWTHTMLGNSPQAQQDVVFELVSVCHNVSMWYTKHAAKIAGKDDINMDEAKEVHKCLRKAAGILSYLQEHYNGRLLDGVEQGSDVDPHVVKAYIGQCTAEAQEVTIARAIEMKHNPALISALAHETAKMFTMAAEALATMDARFEKWRKYLQIKSVFYLAYAYCYAGENLLGQNLCGEAIRALQESQKCHADASKLCKEYASLKSRGMTACRPETNPFFVRLGVIVRRTLEKCERENGFIYHQKIPPDPPSLELKATHGLASPEHFEMPPPSPLWSSVTYAAFDLSRTTFPNDPANSKAAAKAEGDLPPVQEAVVQQSTKEPKTSSGCNVS